MYPYAAKKEPFPPPPSPGGLELVHFENMKPRLGDGYLIKGLLGSGAMAVLYGESGSGKTFLALHLGLCVAGEIEVFGHRVRQCGVVYIAAEAGRGIENRVAAAKQEFEFPEMMPFAAIETPVDLCTQAADTDAIADAIRNADLGMPVELIIIDTLSRVMAGGNENAPDDMGALVRNLDRLRADTGGGILIVHHTGKELSRGARGHSLLRAATDTEIETTKDEAIYTARVTKQRDYATEGSFAFSLHQVELGFDRDGDQITSCIVEPSDSAAKADKPGKRLSDDTRIALRTLRKAISEAGEPAPASNHIPTAAHVVSVETWRRYHYAGTASDGRNTEARKMQFRRDRKRLLAAEIIGLNNDLCWVVADVTGIGTTIGTAEHP